MFNHRVGINKTTLRDHIKKRMPRAGDSLSTTKPTLRDHPKVAKMIGITLLDMDARYSNKLLLLHPR